MGGKKKENGNGEEKMFKKTETKENVLAQREKG